MGELWECFEERDKGAEAQSRKETERVHHEGTKGKRIRNEKNTKIKTEDWR